MGRIEKGSAASSRLLVAPPQPEAVIDFRGIAETLRRQIGLIMRCLLVGGILGLLAAFLIPARYEATTEVYLDPRNLVVLQNEINPVVGTGEESSLISQSQAQLARSTAVLESVVSTLRLDKDRDFGSPEPSLLDTIRKLLTPNKTASAETPQLKAVRALNRDLTVRRSDKSFVIDISVKTSDADKSAEIANAVASAFIKELGRSNGLDVRRASKALDGRLADLRSRLTASDRAVESYRMSHDLIGIDGHPLNEQQLAELTAQLSNAQREVTTAASRLQAVRRLREGDDLPADTEESMHSVALAAIRATLAQAKRAAAEAAVTYGPLYPATKELAVRVSAARQQLQAELTRINRAAESDLQRAKSTAASLGEKLAALKERSGKVDEASVELRELQREAAANRSVYESFLNRAKDLQERLYLDTVNAQVVTTALPPLTRKGLSKSIITLLGLAGGLLIGLLLALIRGEPSYDRRSSAFLE